mgnify:FL=1
MQLELFPEKEVDRYHDIEQIDPVDVWDPIKKIFPLQEKGVPRGEYTLFKTGFKDDIYFNDGEIFCGLKSNKSGKILSQHMHGDQYMRVTFTMVDENGNRKDRLKYSWHRLIALAFIKNDDPKRKTSVHHKNKKKDDNRLSNLEWVTPSENAKGENIIRGFSNNYKREARAREARKQITGKNEIEQIKFYANKAREDIEDLRKQYE